MRLRSASVLSLCLATGALALSAGPPAVATEEEAAIRAALDEAPADPGWNRKLGDALMARGAFSEAADAFARAIGSPPDPTLLSSRAVALALAGRIDESLAAHHAWMTAAPEDPMPYASLAAAYGRNGRWEDARKLAEDLDRSDASLWGDAAANVAGQLFAGGRTEDGNAIVDRLIRVVTNEDSRASVQANLEHWAALTGLARLAMTSIPKETGTRILEVFRGEMNPVHPMTDRDRTSREAASREIDAAIRMPELRFKAEPDYPPDERTARREGRVVLLALVGKDGVAAVAAILASAGDSFDRSAVRAVRTWRYSPATVHGRPIAYPEILRIDFKLR